MSRPARSRVECVDGRVVSRVAADEDSVRNELAPPCRQNSARPSRNNAGWPGGLLKIPLDRISDSRCAMSGIVSAGARPLTTVTRETRIANEQAHAVSAVPIASPGASRAVEQPHGRSEHDDERDGLHEP